jgi:hypothetical protein
MFLASTNKVKRVLHLSFIGHARVEDLKSTRDEVMLLLADLPEGFRVLTDLSLLQSMDLACGAEISRMMEVFAHKGMSTVVRVIPEPHKDIGFNILAAFHYQRQIQTVTFESMEEAVRFLSS